MRKKFLHSFLLASFAFFAGGNVLADDVDYTHLVVNSDFEQAVDADCNPVTVTANMNGWSSNAWRPTGTGCATKQFYGWTWQLGFVNESGGNVLGNNSQGLNKDFDNMNGDFACWIGGNYVLPALTEFYQVIDKDNLPAGTYKVQCRLAVEDAKRTSQRLFANNSVQYHGTAAQYAQNLTEGERHTFAGWGSNVRLGQEMVVYTTITDDESLRFGIRTGSIKSDGSTAALANPMWGWFKVDYFRVTKIDPVTAADASLSAITLSAGEINFNSQNETYNVTLPIETTTVTPTATASVQGATVAGTQAVDVTSGTGVSTITVTALDGSTQKNYTINYTVEAAGLNKLDAKVTYSVDNGKLTVNGVDNYTIYNMNGVKVVDVKAAAVNTSVELKSGVYVLKTKTSGVTKIVVR
jgi:hypothetical protein